MAVTTQTVTGDIPGVLEPYYTGVGKPGDPDFVPGLIYRGVGAIYGDTASQNQEALNYAQKYGLKTGIFGTGGVAPMSEMQQDVGTALSTMQVPGSYASGVGAADLAAQGYQGVPGVSAPQLTQFQMSAPDMFNAQAAQQYMSPYMQGVVDVQQRKAIEAAKQAQLGANLGAARQGTYGGARQTLLQGARESGLRSQLGDIQAQGLQSAYEQAAQQFERDRAAQMGVQRTNLEAALGVQQLGAGQSLEAQRANQAAQLAASQGLGNLASVYGSLGTQQLAGQLDLLKTQGAYGDLQRAIDQQLLDAERAYETGATDYGLTKVGQLSNILRGVPITDQTQTTMTPPPSFASQLTGLGLTGIGLYNLLQGK